MRKVRWQRLHTGVYEYEGGVRSCVRQSATNGLLLAPVRVHSSAYDLYRHKPTAFFTKRINKLIKIYYQVIP